MFSKNVSLNKSQWKTPMWTVLKLLHGINCQKTSEWMELSEVRMRLSVYKRPDVASHRPPDDSLQYIPAYKSTLKCSKWPIKSVCIILICYSRCLSLINLVMIWILAMIWIFKRLSVRKFFSLNFHSIFPIITGGF